MQVLIPCLVGAVASLQGPVCELFLQARAQPQVRMATDAATALLLAAEEVADDFFRCDSLGLGLPAKGVTGYDGIACARSACC